jgi:hypothetical protein
MTNGSGVSCAIFAAMAARQLWVFLTDADIQQLVELLERREPGLVSSAGRYLRGESKKLLEEPAALERREALPGERRIYLLHRKHSADVVAHLQPAGPFAGWSQIDEERTDAIVLRLPAAPPGQLQPARLYASTSYWRGAEKIRKRPMFALWANQTLRFIRGQLPSTAVEFMRIGADALAKAQRSELQLTYLYRTIAPAKTPSTDPA